MSHALFNLFAFLAIAATGFGFANGSIASENAFFIVYAVITLVVGRLFLSRAHLSFFDAMKSMVSAPGSTGQGVVAASYAVALISGLLLAGSIAGV